MKTSTVNLVTDYLGLRLAHPFIAGASPLSDRLDSIRKLEDAGASAIVLRSLFAEQLSLESDAAHAFIEAHEESFAEATSYFPTTVDYAIGPERYLTHLASVKEAVSIPVIASLNGTTIGSWTDFAIQLEAAGADALELNLYLHPSSFDRSGVSIEQECLETIAAVRRVTRLPLAVKISPFFSSIPHFASQAVGAGANAIVLFNRYYQPSINIDDLEVVPSLRLSDSSELLLRIRWTSLLYRRINCQLAITGGVHTCTDAIQGIMAGANVLQLVSLLLREGPNAITNLVSELQHWMEEKEYESIDEMRGSMSALHSPNPEAFERANYIQILQTWKVDYSRNWN
ncbi:MAG: dihydroorotate dehydrogenase-like protein [Puniceicoccaceae bacterium]